MSELIQKHDNRATIRWKLLTGASALALIASSPSMAGDGADYPLLWIEIGGNADILSGFGAPFTAPFLEQTPTPTPYFNGSPVDLQKPPRFTFGGEGTLSFQPDGSDWVFSAGIRYGRSNNKRSVHHQTTAKVKGHNGYYDLHKFVFPGQPSHYSYLPTYKYVSGQKFAQTVVEQSEHHMVLDFQAGKDVGLGMFGGKGSSILSAGMRMARFDSHFEANIRAKPNVTFYSTAKLGGHIHYTVDRWSTYYLQGVADRSFKGVGPSLSWSASAPIAGTVQDGELSIDWGVNGSVLFGRQRAKVSHHTTQRNFQPRYSITVYTPGGAYFYSRYKTHYRHNPPDQNRSRNVTVPNLGAFAGISYRIEDAKLSLGYRADYFFGAMDGGIDAAKKTTLGFNGLYASISIGLGD